MKRFLCSPQLVMFLSLTACDARERMHADNPEICTRPPISPLLAASAAWEQKDVLNGCLHRWGYRLSRAEGSLKDIAEATFAACEDAVDKAAQMVQSEDKESFSRIEAWRDYAMRQALFRVAQARAGDCRLDRYQPIQSPVPPPPPGFKVIPPTK